MKEIFNILAVFFSLIQITSAQGFKHSDQLDPNGIQNRFLAGHENKDGTFNVLCQYKAWQQEVGFGTLLYDAQGNLLSASNQPSGVLLSLSPPLVGEAKWLNDDVYFLSGFAMDSFPGDPWLWGSYTAGVFNRQNQPMWHAAKDKKVNNKPYIKNLCMLTDSLGACYFSKIDSTQVPASKYNGIGVVDIFSGNLVWEVEKDSLLTSLGITSSNSDYLGITSDRDTLYLSYVNYNSSTTHLVKINWKDQNAISFLTPIDGVAQILVDESSRTLIGGRIDTVMKGFVTRLYLNNDTAYHINDLEKVLNFPNDFVSRKDWSGGGRGIISKIVGELHFVYKYGTDSSNGFGTCTFNAQGVVKNNLLFGPRYEFTSVTSTKDSSLFLTAWGRLASYKGHLFKITKDGDFGQSKLSFSEEDYLKEGLLLYPNPASQSIILQLPTAITKEPITINLYNLNGQRVKIIPYNGYSTQIEIPLSDVATGLYTIELSQGSEVWREKLLVE